MLTQTNPNAIQMANRLFRRQPFVITDRMSKNQKKSTGSPKQIDFEKNNRQMAPKERTLLCDRISHSRRLLEEVAFNRPFVSFWKCPFISYHLWRNHRKVQFYLFRICYIAIKTWP